MFLELIGWFLTSYLSIDSIKNGPFFKFIFKRFPLLIKRKNTITLVIVILQILVSGTLVIISQLNSRELNSRLKIINSIEIRSEIDFPTLNSVSEKYTNSGISSSIALFDSNRERYRFITDFQWSGQQITTNTHRIYFTYKPENPEQILGKPLTSLENIQHLAIRYDWFVKNYLNTPLDITGTTTLNYKFFVNGVNIGTYKSSVKNDLLYNSTSTLLTNISPFLKNIDKKYLEAIKDLK